ncbi:MAG: hypothetical protein MHPSP_000377, partial [Paramarteilia canceri]
MEEAKEVLQSIIFETNEVDISPGSSAPIVIVEYVKTYPEVCSNSIFLQYFFDITLNSMQSLRRKILCERLLRLFESSYPNKPNLCRKLLNLYEIFMDCTRSCPIDTKIFKQVIYNTIQSFCKVFEKSIKYDSINDPSSVQERKIFSNSILAAFENLLSKKIMIVEDSISSLVNLLRLEVSATNGETVIAICQFLLMAFQYDKAWRLIDTLNQELIDAIYRFVNFSSSDPKYLNYVIKFLLERCHMKNIVEDPIGF